MNFESIGEPFCIIKNTNPKANIPILSISADDEARNSFNEIILKPNETFQLIPNPQKERQILYISGQSGSGKSYFVMKYCNEFKKIFPKRDIYLLSSVNEDSSIDKIKGLKRIKLTPEFLEDTLTAEDFKDTCVIFDDCDTISDKKIRKKVKDLFDSIAQTGRHFNVYCCVTSHLACNAGESKHQLNESNSITIFPKSMGNRSLK